MSSGIVFRSRSWSRCSVLASIAFDHAFVARGAAVEDLIHFAGGILVVAGDQIRGPAAGLALQRHGQETAQGRERQRHVADGGVSAEQRVAVHLHDLPHDPIAGDEVELLGPRADRLAPDRET